MIEEYRRFLRILQDLEGADNARVFLPADTPTKGKWYNIDKKGIKRMMKDPKPTLIFSTVWGP